MKANSFPCSVLVFKVDTDACPVHRFLLERRDQTRELAQGMRKI